YSWLTQLEYKQHCSHRDNSSNCDDALDPVNVRALRPEDKCHRVTHRQFLVFDHSRHNERNGDVKYRAHNQRCHHASRKIPLRVSALLGSSRYRVKANIGKEDGGDAFQHTSNAIGSERTPVLNMDVTRADNYDQYNDPKFQIDHCVRGPFRFLDSNVYQQCDYERDSQSWQIAVEVNAKQAWRFQNRQVIGNVRLAEVLQLGNLIQRHVLLHIRQDLIVSGMRRAEICRQVFGNIDTVTLQKCREIAAPRNGDCDIADGIFHQQIPSYYPRD